MIDIYVNDKPFVLNSVEKWWQLQTDLKGTWTQ